MEEKENRICKLCKGTLRAVGNGRKNGKNHDDWKSREYHKKCWKDIRTHRRALEIHRNRMKIGKIE